MTVFTDWLEPTKDGHYRFKRQDYNGTIIRQNKITATAELQEILEENDEHCHNDGSYVVTDIDTDKDLRKIIKDAGRHRRRQQK